MKKNIYKTHFICLVFFMKDIVHLPHPHTIALKSLFTHFETTEHWLSTTHLDDRYKRFWYNVLESKKETPWILIFLQQFNNILVYILLFVVVVSIVFGKYIDAGVILGVLIVNALVWAVQEIKADKAVKSLSSIVVQSAKVKRDNHIIMIPAKDLVPGDILIIEEWDKIMADARLISISNFRTIESALTGETYPVSKLINVYEENTSLADRFNMVWMGTYASSGRAEAIVIGTGWHTHIGKIASSLSTIEANESQFQKNIASLSKIIAWVAIIWALINVWLSYLDWLPRLDTVMFGIASLVSWIPEWLPAILSLVLAIWARSMSDRNAIVRSLTAVETLGAVSIICTDKTGTLTENAMTVENIITSPEQLYSVSGNWWNIEWDFFDWTTQIKNIDVPADLKKMVIISTLCNQWSINKDRNGELSLVGDPTEIALYVVWKKQWLDKNILSDKYTIIDDLPFNAEKKMRATLIQHDKQKELFIVWAADNMISHSILSLDEKEKRLNIIDIYSSQGKRVLWFATKIVDTNISHITTHDLNEMQFVWCVVIQDPIRIQVPWAISACHDAWIRVIMMTGDHKSTARSIGMTLWLVNETYPDVYTESDLYTMSDEEIFACTKTCNIFARCTPERKLQILSLLQDKGEIVAMTGDGVNDAPALKKADVWIAMWIMGTDVARESSSIILADDNFATIVTAIEQWRIIYNNVKKSSLLAINRVIAGMWSLIAILLRSNAIPFAASQLLWLNLVTETITGIGIAFEWAEGNEMKQKPRPINQSFVTAQDMINILINALVMIILVVGIYIRAYSTTGDKIFTVTISFLVLYFCQFTNLYNLRSFNNSIGKIWLFTNKAIIIWTFISLLLQAIALYRPPLANMLWFTWISMSYFILTIGLSLLVLVAWEIYKYICRKNLSPIH
jgi:Ca2+-transporting ATPase